ncbi:hypothetical protein LCGC14_1067920 [marine sediment metagenome]|uniref:Uncharacterized protein n=1 Tax=marine sediment metagenome TaxID=412755 RepID=A0A0F9Q2B4_9ZZZZ
MTDIINLDDFRKAKEVADPLTRIKRDSKGLTMVLISSLFEEGYDIQDPDFLLDMEAILRLLTATLCRQCDIEHKYIKELDDLHVPKSE